MTDMTLAASDTDEYAQRLRTQQEQYKSGAELHTLPDIFSYWTNRYVLPHIQGAFGVNTITEIYAKPLVALCQQHARARFYSIGSGDSSSEIQIAQYLLEHGCSDFQIAGLEVHEGFITEGRAAIEAAGLSHMVSTQFFDVNKDAIEGPVHAYLAQQSLHHIVELERLFDLIERTLADDGHFITCDMIGRNGHMRWPETLRLVEAIWAQLPEVKKFNWQFRETHHEFVNWDCTSGGTGWEGIRAQDILPLLLERFSFQAFAATGGFIDVFVERGIGPNFDPANPADRDFIDGLAVANDALIDAGLIKPTMIFADMVKKGAPVVTKIVGKRSPEFCVRYPGLQGGHALSDAPDEALASRAARSAGHVALAERDFAIPQRDERAAELDPLIADRDAINADRGRIIAHGERLAAEVKALAIERGKLELELGRVAADLRAIHRSRSWRFTAPLRDFVGRLRGVKGGGAR
jgi:hypothetical protein